MTYEERWKLLRKVVYTLHRRYSARLDKHCNPTYLYGMYVGYLSTLICMTSDRELKEEAISLGILPSEHWYPRGYGIVEQGWWLINPSVTNEDYFFDLACNRLTKIRRWQHDGVKGRDWVIDEVTCGMVCWHWTDEVVS